MLRLRQSLVDAEKQLSEFKLRCSEVEAELSVTKRELVTAQSDCSFYPSNHTSNLNSMKLMISDDGKKQ